MQIDIYCELNWAVERPVLDFTLNGDVLAHEMQIVDTLPNQERVMFTMQSNPKYDEKNFLEITFSEKTDDKVTADCDHWVSVKDIAIDGVRSNWLLFKNTTFEHSMPAEWVENMINQGYDIQPEYSPGTDLRLNGTCKFWFTLPYWQARVFDHQKYRGNY